MKIRFSIVAIVISSFLFFMHCTKDNPAPTGTFTVELSGDNTESFGGIAYFSLSPSGDNGIISIRLDKNDAEYFRLAILNPDPTQVFLEPGTYNVVPRLGNDIKKEVLINYINATTSYTATSGQVTVGISKNEQITGQLLNVKFDAMNTTVNGNYDAIPQ